MPKRKRKPFRPGLTRPALLRPRLDSPSGVLSARSPALDSLRGLAILLMIVDHVAGNLFSINIQLDSIRFWTRLSMPLFAVLMGYFFRSRPLNRRRITQVAVACLLVNLSYVWMYRELEILASLLCAQVLFLGMGPRFVWLALAICLAPWDPSSQWFDYPLTIVCSFVAVGKLLRERGTLWAASVASLMLPMTAVIPGHTAYLLYFLTPAVLLVAVAQQRCSWTLPGLQRIGTYPLSIYVIQHYVIWAIASLVRPD